MNEDIQKLIDVSVALERQQCAHHYLKIMREAVTEAREREREACAKVCEQIIKESEINYKESEFEKQQRLLCLKMIEIPIKNAAAAIRARERNI